MSFSSFLAATDFLAAEAGTDDPSARLTNLGHSTLLVFWVQILVIWTTARLFGAAARRVGLPSVVGELTAGLFLGPSIFGVVWGDGFDWFLPQIGEATAVPSALLLAVSWFSAAFLLVVAGFETDLGLISRLGKVAVLVTAGSLVVPLAGGLVAGSFLPESLWGASGTRLTVTLFIGVSVAVSALAVVAKVLSDLGLMRRDVGQITVAAGMANDVIGWIILGVISGLAVSGEVSVLDAAVTILGLGLFLVGSLTIGQRLVDGGLRAVRREGANLQGALTVALATMFVMGVITQWLGVEAVLGTFVAGVVLMRSRYQQVEAAHVIEDLTSVVFAPLFFATAGLRIDLGLLRGDALRWSFILLALALSLKFGGTYLGARLGGLTNREGFVLGAGLNARGALEIIIATVGLSLGVFNQTSFTMIVLIPLVTSLVASVGVRMFSRDLEGSVAERERLTQESALAKNLVVRNGRILLPSQGLENSIVAAQIVQFAWPEDLGATVVAIDRDDGGKPQLEPITNVLYGRDVDVVPVESAAAAEQMIAQSKLGYGVAAVGVPDVGESYVSGLVDDLLSELRIPLVMVRRARNTGGRLPGIFARALVPVAGSRSSRASMEVAGNLSARLGTQLTLSHVVYRDGPVPAGGILDRFREGAFPKQDDDDVADRVLAQASAQAQELRANFETETRFANSPGAAIVRHASQIDADLIVIGAELRHLEEKGYLGPNVEYVLEHAEQTVAVVVLPPDAK